MNLHVGNLAAGMTVKALREAFEPHGKVGAVTIPSTGMHEGEATGTHRGYGFVRMPDKAQAVAAVAALHQRPLGGQAVTVQLARAPRRG
ncbi:MAG TPA: RNA-binding protein [Planctomycetota bacterium]